jgi:hypothetical protein
MEQTPALTIAAGLIALLSLTACYIYGPPPKANVPVDFPVYPGSAPISEVYGAAPLPDGSKDRREHYDITWNTDDNGAKLFAYYKSQLAHRDWVEQSTSGNGQGGLITFNRISNPAWGGAIYLADHKIHVVMGDGCPCGAPT